VVCNSCYSVYDVNTEFCVSPEEINKCEYFAACDYKEWDQEKRHCAKCGVEMEVIEEKWGLEEG
jgi:NADH pyrophosphatase NudC (nudix superfamily)